MLGLCSHFNIVRSTVRRSSKGTKFTTDSAREGEKRGSDRYRPRRRRKGRAGGKKHLVAGERKALLISNSQKIFVKEYATCIESCGMETDRARENG